MIIKFSSLLHSIHHGEQVVQCVSVTVGHKHNTEFMEVHSNNKNTYIYFRRSRIFSDIFTDIQYSLHLYISVNVYKAC